MGQDFRILVLWHQHRFSHPKKHTDAEFEEQMIILSRFYGDLIVFWTISGNIGGLWRHKRGQDFKILEFWHQQRFSHTKKHTNAKFKDQMIILSRLIVI
jgi:hypothetical protein